jgi:hypothetical protein
MYRVGTNVRRKSQSISFVYVSSAEQTFSHFRNQRIRELAQHGSGVDESSFV